MAELVYALVLGTSTERFKSSSLFLPTMTMKVTIDSKKGLKTNLKVFVDKKTIEEKILLRLNELSKTINLKGFRPGKVPINILRNQFGKAVYSEVLEKVLQETSTKALEEKKIKPAGQPKLDLKSYGENKDLTYSLEVDALPTIKLQSLENIKFTDYEINVEDKEITSRLKLNNDEIELIKDTIFTFIRFINRQYEISQTDKKVYCLGGFLYRNLEKRVNLSTSIREKDF